MTSLLPRRAAPAHALLCVLLVLLVLIVAACSSKPAAPVAPVTVAAIPTSSASAASLEPPRQDAATGQRADVDTVDGAKLGSPISTIIGRAPYDKPCDVDPIDEKKATLYFWAAGPCRDAPPFPGGTSLVILTSRTTDMAAREQAITLIAWAGGTYFDDKSSLRIRIGDTLDDAKKALGDPSQSGTRVELRNGKQMQTQTLSWGHIHVLAAPDKIVAIAIGELDLSNLGERSETLDRLYGHHLRYAR